MESMDAAACAAYAFRHLEICMCSTRSLAKGHIIICVFFSNLHGCHLAAPYSNRSVAAIYNLESHHIFLNNL
jgi:hypothetical protein